MGETRIGLVGCASQKLSRPAQARDLYVSHLFRKARAYVEQECEEWWILSAKHGLVHPDEVLEPYDVKLGSGRTAPPIHDWALATATDVMIRALMPYRLSNLPDPEVVVLAGGQYRTLLMHLPKDLKVTVPMEGLGIGEQLAWLTKAVA